MVKKLITDNFGYSAEIDEFFIPADIEELQSIIKQLNRGMCVFKVVGNLSNILLATKLLNLSIIRLTKGVFAEMRYSGSILEAGAGVDVKSLLNFCLKNSLSGLEFLIGIPGTIGGVLASNAGAFGKEVGDNILKIDCFNLSGERRSLKREDIHYAYRDSSLKGFVITKAYLKVNQAKRERIKEEMALYMKKRINNQDFHKFSCGCFFKNPQNNIAGMLIEKEGFLGKKRGDAYVSTKHGNFLLVSGNRDAFDLLSLKDAIQRRCWLKNRIWLQEEVEILC